MDCTYTNLLILELDGHKVSAGQGREGGVRSTRESGGRQVLGAALKNFPAHKQKKVLVPCTQEKIKVK